ncbi:tripartite tricarboxylate transporter family receptor [Halalkalicoccus paucihalophilus]|uniref:Tripartite tricarboxylate transporter family receptor n=1 Tax=Halalkalicoccus paucihalophilus TaxID=1008153 RepID=A0A151AC03_9EURY|nr:tripartite tricarboxylate transporter substrate binding protein [Halalkalicoccus paucihalophilus]KYH25042.1 tripartite tricarboxylate transporter family receptor [Halalkalicoccus paucihalophilus]
MAKRDVIPHNEIGRREYITTVGALGMGGLAGCAGQLGGDEEEGEFPSQDIEMICPWAAGGGTDLTGRQIADLAQDPLGVSLYVTNQTGGSGSAGFNAIANAETNGYTVGITTVEICTISHLGIADVTPEDLGAVIQYNFDPAALTVPEDAPYSTLEEFVAYAEENPGEIRVSNSGTGAIWHLSAAGFAQQAGIELSHVGYDGGSPATQAVVSGEVEATAASAPEVAGQVQDGPLEILAVFGEERLDMFPEVPTLQELGYDFTMGAWRGLTVPQGTDEERIGTLEEGFTSVYESDEFQSFMEEQGFGLVYRDAEEFGQFMQSEYDRFGGIIDELGLEQSG